MRNWDDDEDGYCTAAADLQDARRVCDDLRHPAAHGELRRRVSRAGVRSFPRRARGGSHAQPGRRLQPRDQVRRLFRARTAAGRRRVSPRDTTPGSTPRRAARGCSAAATAPRTRATSCTRCRRQAFAHCVFPDRRPAEDRSAAPGARRSRPPGARQARQHRYLFHRRATLCRIPCAATCLRGPGRSRRRRACASGRIAVSCTTRWVSARDSTLGGVRGAAEAPWYVARKDLDRNVLVVVQDATHPLLTERRSFATEVAHWIAGSPPAPRFRCTVKLRYRQADQPCTVDACSPDGRCDRPDRRRHSAR